MRFQKWPDSSRWMGPQYRMKKEWQLVVTMGKNKQHGLIQICSALKVFLRLKYNHFVLCAGAGDENYGKGNEINFQIP